MTQNTLIWKLMKICNFLPSSAMNLWLVNFIPYESYPFNYRTCYINHFGLESFWNAFFYLHMILPFLFIYQGHHYEPQPCIMIVLQCLWANDLCRIMAVPLLSLSHLHPSNPNCWGERTHLHRELSKSMLEAP